MKSVFLFCEVITQVAVCFPCWIWQLLTSQYSGLPEVAFGLRFGLRFDSYFRSMTSCIRYLIFGVVDFFGQKSNKSKHVFFVP